MTKQEYINRNKVLLEKDLTEYIFKKNHSSDETQAFLEGIQFVSNWVEDHKHEDNK